MQQSNSNLKYKLMPANEESVEFVQTIAYGKGSNDDLLLLQNIVKIIKILKILTLRHYVPSLVLMTQHFSESSDDGINTSTSFSSPTWQEVRTSMRSLLMRLSENSLVAAAMVLCCDFGVIYSLPVLAFPRQREPYSAIPGATSL